VKRNISTKSYIIAFMISFLFCITLSYTFYSTFKNEIDQSKNTEREDVIERFLHYRSQTENLFNQNEYLLKGYIAYLETHPEASPEESEKYLSYLIKGEENLIRSITTIRDTTIITTYPLKGNEAALGVDLSKIPIQGEKVLEVKNNLKQTLQGPLELIQGGFGFILRTPIVNNETGYWGQVSIIIDVGNFIQKATSYEKENDLEITLFNNDTFKDKPFMGSNNTLRDNPVILDMELSNTVWKAAIIPRNGWGASKEKYEIKFIVMILLTLTASLLLYNHIITRFKLKSQVIHDHLTGLYTRAFLDEYYQLTFEKAKRNCTKVLILLLDINDFKNINDTYGHKAGDEVLRLIANQLLKICRKSEAVFRLGGDEFLIIIPDIEDLSDVKVIKERIKKAVTVDYLHQNKEIKILSSIGSAVYPVEGSDFDGLTHVADEDMYRQKSALKRESNL
jgi:diguanylate cyclase (GGDEF)-like protein